MTILTMSRCFLLLAVVEAVVARPSSFRWLTLKIVGAFSGARRAAHVLD